MSLNSVDELEIQLKAESKNADASIDKLSNSLNGLINSMQRLGTASSGLNQFSYSVRTLTNAMNLYKNSGVSGSTFNSLATGLSKFNGVNSSSITNLANAIQKLYGILPQNGNASASAQAIKDLTESIGKLGLKKTEKAIVNIPQLEKALQSLFTTLSKAPTVNRNIISTMNALTNLASQGRKVSSATNGLNKAFKINNKSMSTMNTHIAKSHKGFVGLASSIGMFYAKFFMLIRLMKGAGSSIKSTMDYIESYNFFDVASKEAVKNSWKELGKESAEVYLKEFEGTLADLNKKMTGLTVNTETGDFSVSNLSNLGIDLTALTTFESEVISITSSLGLLANTSLNTSKALTMLVADMSSLHNVDLTTVMRNFQSGIIGQSRALYKYGIDITNATLSQYALANGITKSVTEMSQAEKMQLRMLAIFQQMNGNVAQSQNAWGDLANTMDQSANQLRRLQNGFKNLGMMIGKLFLPMVQTTLPYLNAMIIVLQRVADSLANFFGISLDGASDKTATSDILEEIVEDSEDATESLNKLNKQLAKFDNLNNLTSSNTSGLKDLSNQIDLSVEIAEAVANYEKVWEEAFSKIEDKSTQIADRITNAFKLGDYKGMGETIANSIENQLSKIDWKKVYGGAKDFGSGLAQFLNGAITPELFGSVGKTVAGSLNTSIYTALQFNKDFDWENMSKSFISGINEFIREIDGKAFAESLNEFVDGLEVAVGTALEEFDWNRAFELAGDIFTNLEIDTLAAIIGVLSIKKIGKITIGATLGNFLLNAIKGWIGTILSGLTISNLAIAFSTFSLAPVGGWEVMIDGIITDISDAIKNLLPQGLYDAIDIGGTVAVLVGMIGNPIVAIFAGLFAAAPVDWNKVFRFEIANSFFDHAIECFKTAFDGNRDGLMDIGGYIFDGIISGFIGALTFLVEPIYQFFAEFVRQIKEAFGIHSPAKEMNIFGKYIFDGIFVGFTDRFSKIPEKIQEFLDEIAEKLGLDKCKKAFENIGKGIEEVWESAIENIKKIWNTFAKWVNKHLTFETPEITLPGGKTVGGNKLGLEIPTFATGGIVEDGLFMANHNELVGKFSNGKTAVANNKQITDGIEEASYRGFMRALSESGNNGSSVRVVLEGDAKGLFNVVRTEADENHNMSGEEVFVY